MTKFLVTREAAEYCGMSGGYMLNQAKTGKLAYIQPSPKKIMFSKDDLDVWMQSWKKFATTETNGA